MNIKKMTEDRSGAATKSRLVKIYNVLEKRYGHPKCPLTHNNPLQLMAATILSAQCTDKRVNTVTPELFSRYSDAESFANAAPADVEKIIRPLGFYRSKAKSIIESCKRIVKDFDGKIPSTMEKLVSLPGIGRKTANVILGNAFDTPGFPVDTHVKRLLNRIGIVKDLDDPVKIEMVIIDAMPKKYWTNFSHLLIFHGRDRCKARKPDCENCEILKYCEHGKRNKK